MSLQGKLTFHIGGSRFDIYGSTIEKRCGHRWLTQLAAKSDRLSPHEFFIDRNPIIFSCVLDYCRTGHLHVPHNICGSMIKEELQFWDISPALVRPCCWAPFTTDDHIKHAGNFAFHINIYCNIAVL